jgi:hypothetical protein
VTSAWRRDSSTARPGPQIADLAEQVRCEVKDAGTEGLSLVQDTFASLSAGKFRVGATFKSEEPIRYNGSDADWTASVA